MKTANLSNAPFAERAIYINNLGVNSHLNFIGRLGQTTDKTETLIEKIESKKGQISTVYMLSDLDASMKKTGNPFFGKGFFKYSVFQVRFGISYENKGSTIEKREAGIEAQPPKGKTWIDFPYWMRSEKTGEILVACSSLKNGNSFSFFLDNEFNDLPKAEVENFLKAKNDFSPDWYTIGLKKILRVV